MEYALIVFVIFFLIVCVLLIVYAIKQNKKKDQFLKQLSPAQRHRLETAETVRSQEKDGGFTTEGMIAEFTERNDQFYVSVVFFNRGVAGKSNGKPMLLEIPADKAEINANHLQIGSFVKFFTNAYDVYANARGGLIGGFEAAEKKKSYLIF